MNPVQAIADVALGAIGLFMVARCMPVLRRATLASRMHPYMVSLAPRSSRLLVAGGIGTGVGGAFGLLTHDLGQRLHRLLGDDSKALSARIDAAGLSVTPSQFRTEQAVWGLGGFFVGLVMAVLAAASGRSLSLPMVLIAAGSFGVCGVLMRDRKLDRILNTRRIAMLAELPTVADLVCLAVTAGESLRGAIELVATEGQGPLAGELRAVLRDTRSGRPIADALSERSQRAGLAPFTRFSDSVLAASERGMPLAESLRALSSDVRDSQKYDVIESAGRKQITMLVPVVALILPVAIVFAFFPGLIAIRMLAQ